MPDTAALVVALSAQLTKFEADMLKANEIAKKNVQQIENTFATANLKVGGLDEFADKFTKLLTIGGIIETVRQLAALNEQVAHIGDQSEILGLTTDQFQKLQFAAVAVGSSTEKMTAFLDQFSRKVGEAASGTGALYNFLTVNNIEATKFSKIPINDQLAKFADLIKGLRSPQEQMNALANASGRNFGELLEVFRGGAAGLEIFNQAAVAAGTVMDSALIERAKKANQEWKILQLQVTTFFEEAALSAADAAKKLKADNEKTGADWSQFLKDKWKSFIDYMKETRPEVLKNVTDLMDGITEIVERKNAEILSRAPKVPDILAGREQGAPATFDERFKPALGTTTPEEDKRTKIFNEQDEVIRKLIQAQQKRNELLDSETAHISQAAGVQAFYRTEIDLYNQAIEKNKSVTDAQYDAILRVAAATELATQRAFQARQQWEGLNSVVQFAGNQMIDVMVGLTQGTLTASKAMQQLTQALIKALLQAALLGQGPLGNLLFPAAQAGGTGGLGGIAVSGLKSLFARQAGGPVTSGHPYVVGEHGPELFVPGSSGQIVPNSVSRSGGGSQIVVNNYVAADTQVSQRKDNSGGINGERLIIDIVKKAQARGDFDDSNRGRFALRPAKVR